MSASDLVDLGNGTKSVTFAWSPDMEQGNRSYLMCFQFFDDTRFDVNNIIFEIYYVLFRMPSNQVCFALVTSSA